MLTYNKDAGMPLRVDNSLLVLFPSTERTRPLVRFFKQKHDRSAYSLTDYSVFSNCIQRTAKLEIMLAHEILTVELPHRGKALFLTERTRPLVRFFK